MKALIGYVRRHRIWQVAVILMLAFAVYWTLFAARRYVSEAHVVVESAQGAPVAMPDLSSALTGPTAPRDLLLLRDYLLSADMLAKLDAELGLRKHYNESYDVFSRLLYPGIAFEWFLQHYHNRVRVEYDETSAVLVIQAQAYTPAMAHAIASTMLAEGDRFMNELAQRLAREQVVFAEKEASVASRRMAQARQELLEFQNAQGLVSPSATVESISAVAARLESELSDLQARRHALEAYLAPTAPDLVQVREQIRALEKQLQSQRARLASSNGKTLNRVAEAYDRLALQASFEQAVYQTSITTLERARLDATRTLKKVSVLQQPTMPQFAMEPGRLYNSLVFLLGTLLLTGILHMLIAIIREHRD